MEGPSSQSAISMQMLNQNCNFKRQNTPTTFWHPIGTALSRKSGLQQYGSPVSFQRATRQQSPHCASRRINPSSSPSFPSRNVLPSSLGGRAIVSGSPRIRGATAPAARPSKAPPGGDFIQGSSLIKKDWVLHQSNATITAPWRGRRSKGVMAKADSEGLCRQTESWSHGKARLNHLMGHTARCRISKSTYWMFTVWACVAKVSEEVILLYEAWCQVRVAGVPV